MNTTQNYPIDFVLAWVDGNDPAWRKEKEEYWQLENPSSTSDGNKAARFRDWENLKYWFRGVEKYAPWVNKIFFLTWGHVPEWLEMDHPKLRVVRHEAFIPKECLPVFSSHPIELNMHRISELSEHFVYFNDDMFLGRPATMEDFFEHNIQHESPMLYPLRNEAKNDSFIHILLTTTGLINSSFNVLESIKANRKKWINLKLWKYALNNLMMLRFRSISGILTPHNPSALKKSTCEEVWNSCEPFLSATSHNRFRNPMDVNQYIFRYWAMMKGDFIPKKLEWFGKEFFASEEAVMGICTEIESESNRMFCINDMVALSDFEAIRDRINQSFAKVFPVKSKYEK